MKKGAGATMDTIWIRRYEVEQFGRTVTNFEILRNGELASREPTLPMAEQYAAALARKYGTTKIRRTVEDIEVP